MADYEYEFVTLLQRKLKDKIIGRIYVAVIENDTLLIKIERIEGMVDRIFIGNFSDRIRNGWTTDYAVYEVMKEYKQIINRRYFY